MMATRASVAAAAAVAAVTGALVIGPAPTSSAPVAGPSHPDVRTRPDEEAAVRAALQNYLKAHATGRGEYHRRVFHRLADLSWVSDGELQSRTSEAYIAAAPGQPAEDEADRDRRIEMVDVTGDAAVARIVLDYPAALITDYMSLLKVDGEWRIVNKIFHVERRPTTAGDREQEAGDRAFLFAYRARGDDRVSLFEGYREHLDWHVEREDPLRWLAWTVATGPRTGLFVDGTFGNGPRAFDQRVDPAEDARHAARTFLPHAEPVWRAPLRLRPDLGGSRRLEEGEPSRLMLMAKIEGEPGGAAALETALASALERADGDGDASVYEVMAGGPGPTYFLAVPAESWAGVAEAHDLVRGLLRRATPASRETAAAGSASGAGAPVRAVETEVWRYRADLSYFPGAG